MKKNLRYIGIFAVLVLWGALTVFAWVKPAGETSEAERRPLAQFPVVSGESLLSGKFVTDFEAYTLDQFPGRDLFRKLKALVHYNVLGQKDNNGIYIEDGYAAKLDYPVNENGLNHALDRLNFVYETYLKDTGSKVYASVIPDKGYYLAEKNGYPAMDYEKLFAAVQEKLPESHGLLLYGYPLAAGKAAARCAEVKQRIGSHCAKSRRFCSNETGQTFLWCVLRSGCFGDGTGSAVYPGK